METAFYDSEDKCYHAFDTIEESVVLAAVMMRVYLAISGRTKGWRSSVHRSASTVTNADVFPLPLP